MDPTILATRLALIEERYSVTQLVINNISSDFREVKDAVLRLVASVENQSDRHLEYEARFKAIEAAADKRAEATTVAHAEQATWRSKVLGAYAVINFIGLPAVMFALMHAPK